MLKLDNKKPRRFINPLLSKKSITAEELQHFTEVTDIYLSELQKQLMAKQSEPNIVSNALKSYFEALGYTAQSYSQKGQSGMDLALMKAYDPRSMVYELYGLNAKEIAIVEGKQL